VRPPPVAARPLPVAGKSAVAPPPVAPPRRPATSAQPLTQPLRAEQPKQSLARSFYWSELRIGDDLPPLSKVAVDRVQISRYAAASGDFNRLHLDEPFAHGVGFPGVFAPGMLAMGFIGQLLTSWLRRGHVRRLSARFVKIVWPGDELTCRGRIADLRKEHGGCYADVELWAENQKGELVLRGQATCELYESPAAAGGDGAGFLFGPQAGGKPGGLAQARPAPEARPARPAPSGPAKKK
jgi:acyl dehydratase